MAEGRCHNSFALPIYGERPSPLTCEICPYRSGMRGMGDVVAYLIAVVKAGFRKPKAVVVKKGCGCARRQAALNAVFPLSDGREQNDRFPDSQPRIQGDTAAAPSRVPARHDDDLDAL